MSEEETSVNYEETYNIDTESPFDFSKIDDKIDNMKQFLDTKKEYNVNYQNEVDLNQHLLDTRVGMLNNIKSINNYNKKLIMTLIAIIFGIIITITSIIILNNRK